MVISHSGMNVGYAIRYVQKNKKKIKLNSEIKILGKIVKHCNKMV